MLMIRVSSLLACLIGEDEDEYSDGGDDDGGDGDGGDDDEDDVGDDEDNMHGLFLARCLIGEQQNL